VILAGIFLAIFAGYGLLHIVKALKPRLSITVAGSVLAAFMVIGLAYAVMPHDNPFVLYGAARANTENFSPVTMQFNSLDVEDNEKLLSAIQWINQNTGPGTVIVGERHWRGFMELYLEDDRIYRFSNDPLSLAQALERQDRQAYLITYDARSPAMFEVEDVAIR
jgi:hypothetical protein